MNILSICEEPTTMDTIRIIMLFINIIKVLVPIILILSLAIKFTKAITEHSQEEIMKTLRNGIPNMIAAVIIFLVPTIVDIVIRLTFPNSDYTKCISGITVEKVEGAYIAKMEELIEIAQSTETYTDYHNANGYLPNIKDKEKREEYKELLDELLATIDASRSGACTNKNEYAKVNYENFKWTQYNKNSGPITKYVNDTVSSYAIWAPEKTSDLSGVSLPLIVLFHGSEEFVGKPNSNNYINVGAPQVIKEWASTNLDPIPAIIVAPHGDAGWWSGHKINDVTVEALIKYASDEYKIDTNKIVFWGHSSGGFGAIEMAWDLKSKFKIANIVTMSSQQTSYQGNEGKEYYSKIKIKGYGEIEKQQELFDWIGQPKNFTYYKGEQHMNVPRRAMIEDTNKDGVSDLIYWLFGRNEKCDSYGENFNPHGDNYKAGITATCSGGYENGIGHARLSVKVSSGTAKSYKFINGGATVQSGSSSTYISDDALALLIYPKVTITSSNGLSTTMSCSVSHSEYLPYNERGYYFSVTAAKDKSGSVNNPYLQNRMPYYLHIPKNAGTNERLPLIIGLHGGYGISTCYRNGETFVTTEGTQTYHYFKSVYYSNKSTSQINGGKDNDINAVILTISNTKCSWNDGMYSAMNIIHAIIKLYNIDLNRIVLTGVSQGGAGTLYLGFLEENILFRAEDNETTLSSVASRYNTTVDEINRYNKSTDHSINYSDSARTKLKKGSTTIIRSRNENDPRSIFSILVPFSPAKVDYRKGFVLENGATPPHTLKTPIWVITSNDEYALVQQMAEDLVKYYSKAGDVRYTVLTGLHNPHDSDTAFFNRTGAAKWLIEQTYGNVTVRDNPEIATFEAQMGKNFAKVMR